MVLQPHLKVESVSKYCLVSGNPDRIEIMVKKLISPEEISRYRGLVSYQGYTPNKKIPVTLLTSGMGTPSTAIVVEEAYRAGCRTLIRVGSCGSLQVGEEYGIGSIYIPHSAIRDDGTSKKLVPIEYPAIASPSVYQALFIAATDIGVSPVEGPVWTSDVYYFKDPMHFKKYASLGATCVEMESGLIFSYPALKHDLSVGSILTSDGNLNDDASIYNGEVEARVNKFNQSVEKTIDIALKAIEIIDGM